MMTFKKWPSIENHYREKFIQGFLDESPELADEEFIISEKLHGACIQLFFSPHTPMRVGSRNRFLDQDSKFYDIWNTLGKYQEIIDLFQECVNYRPATYRWFGEYFGGNIQKGVSYGPEHRILFFGLMSDDVLHPFSTLADFSQAYGFPLVPIVAKAQSLAAALA